MCSLGHSFSFLACVLFLCSIELHAVCICFVRILCGPFSLLTVTVHAAGQCFLASFFFYHVLEVFGVFAATKFIGPFFLCVFFLLDSSWFFLMAQERWADAVDTPTSSISEPCGPTPAVAMLVVVPDTLRMFPMQVLRQPTLLAASCAERPAPSRSAVSSADLGRWLCTSQVPLPLALRDEVNSFIGWLLEFLCDMPLHRNVRMQIQFHVWQNSLRLRVAIYRLRWFQVFAIYGVEL